MCCCTIGHSLGLSAVTVLTALQCFCFFLSSTGLGRIKSFFLIQVIPLSQDHILRFGRCTWTCAPAYLLVRHPILSWFRERGVCLCPPGVSKTIPRAVNCTSTFLGAYDKQVAQTLHRHWSQPPFLSHSTAGQIYISYIYIHTYENVCQLRSGISYPIKQPLCQGSWEQEAWELSHAPTSVRA